MLLKENYSRSLWESQETNTLRGQDSRKRFMRLALCKRPTWPQYRIKYSRCSQLRPGFIVSSKVLNQFVQVCTKHVRVLCRNIKRSHSYTTATSVYMHYKVKPRRRRGSGGTYLLILNLGDRWTCVVTFTAHPLYSQGESPPPPPPRYPLERRLGRGPGLDILRV
jgi:hypothetical protein